MFGTFAQVCADGVGSNEANVACRELGFSGGNATSADSVFFKPILVLDSLSCSGDESELNDCIFTGNYPSACTRRVSFLDSASVDADCSPAAACASGSALLDKRLKLCVLLPSLQGCSISAKNSSLFVCLCLQPV